MTYLAKSTIQAYSIKVGDTVIKKGKVYEVFTVKVGTKWVTLRDEDGKLILEITTSDELEVLRTELTDEEKAAKKAAQLVTELEWLNQRLAGKLTDWASATPALEGLDFTDYSRLTSAIEAGAQKQVASELLTGFSHANAHRSDGGQEALSLVEFATSWIGRAVKQAIRSNRPMSRSTSVVSNLLGDVTQGVVFGLADDLERGFF